MEYEEEDFNIYLINRYDTLSKAKAKHDMTSFYTQPSLFKPKPTDSDYETGAIHRYFVKKSTSPNFPVYEVDLEQFGVLKRNPFYLSVSLVWKIAGNIETIENDEEPIIGASDFNKYQRESAELEMKGITNVLKNLLEFYKKM